MIGNDIIDLQLAATESNIHRKGWMNKVFTTPERELIEQSSDATPLAWRLWSMKEAAYKALVQHTGKRFFVPSSLICNLKNEVDGTVLAKGKLFRTITTVTDHYIHSIAVESNTGYDSEVIQSAKMQGHLIQEDILDKAEEGTFIQKTTLNIPKLYMPGNPDSTAMSMSHHGRFGAWAIERH